MVGCAHASKWGLEISGIAAVDVDNNFAFHLEVVQTPEGKGNPNSDENLLDWYGKVLYESKKALSELSSYIVADDYFAKKPFVDKVFSMDMHLISRLRDDADLKYLFRGERTGKKGRPRKHDGEIEWKKNTNYQDSLLIVKSPEVYSQFGIEPGKSIYEQIEVEAEKFLFVPQPQLVKEVWDNFLP